MSAAPEIRLLGPFELLVAGVRVPVAASKPRAVLAMLALAAGERVSVDRLVEGLWGEAPPVTAGKVLQHYVWQARRALADADGALIVTRGRAYELRLPPECVDVRRFEQLLARTDGQARLRDALALWRGPPLADLADHPFAAEEIRRLEDLRLDALERAVDADLAGARHRELLPELRRLVAERPDRERLHGQLMLALYRCGRQVEALAVFDTARRSLIDRLGIEPGPGLRDLQLAVLRQDPELDVEPPRQLLPAPLERLLLLPLIGREDELARLRARWSRARSGQGSVVALAGAAGMGKTRLAAELAAQVAREGAAVLVARGAAGLAPIPRERPTLVVLDDIDAGADGVLGATVAPFLAGGAGAPAPVLVLAIARDPSALAGAEAAETLVLLPLAADHARDVVVAHAGAPNGTPVAALVAEARGVPGRLVELALSWAEEAASRQVRDAARRAADERSAAEAVEAELVGGVVTLQRVRARRQRPAADATAAAEVCPFQGLVAYGAVDAGRFFGRERLVAEVVARLAATPLVALVGASGSGKSSVLAAGVLPALQAGVLPGSETWHVAALRPGADPVDALRRATAEVPDGARALVAVDQLEELFAVGGEETRRAAFAAALGELMGGGAAVIAAIRADVYGRFAAYPELARRLVRGHVLVGPMRHDELRSAVERPAALARLRCEPELVDAIIADVEGRPGALPLLSSALVEVWERRDRRQLRLDAYVSTGGVRGAVAALAERAWNALEPTVRPVARTVLLRLADTEGSSGRAVALSDLGDDERVPGVLQTFARHRIVTLAEDTAEVAHEALLTEWPRLRAWLEEDAAGRRTHRHLEAAAREWQALARDGEALYRGSRLAAALEWAQADPHRLNALERDFLTTSGRAAERAQRRLLGVLAAVTALLVIAVAAAVLAAGQRERAQQQATRADAERLGAQALVDDALDRALLLARQGVALADLPQTRANLLAALLRRPAVVGVLRGDGDRLLAADLSPDGSTLALGDNDGTIVLAPAHPGPGATARRTLRGVAAGPVDDLRFSPDGTQIAVAGNRPAVVDVRDRRVLWRRHPRNGTYAYEVRFTPDGRSVLLATVTPRGDAELRALDARTGRPRTPARRISRRDPADVAVSRGGQLVTASFEDREVVVRRADTLAAVRRLPVSAEHVALSQDGRTLLAGGRDGSVRFVDMRTGAVRPAMGRQRPFAAAAAFAANGRTAFTGGADGSLVIWDVASAVPRETFPGHAGRITSLAVAPDGATVYSAALDGLALAWDVRGDRRLGRPVQLGPANRENPRLALSADGHLLATGNGDGSVTIVDASTLAVRRRLAGVVRGPVHGMAFVPHSRLLAVGGTSGQLVLADALTGTVRRRLSGHDGTVYTPSFDRTGRLMATGDDHGRVRLWRLPMGRATGRVFTHAPQLEDVSLSPDGRRLALTGEPWGVDIVDVGTGRTVRAGLGRGAIAGFGRFDRTGRFLVTAGWKGWTRLWSTRDWRPLTRELTGHAGPVTWASLSRDDRTLATGATDGGVRLWDVQAQQPLGPPLPGLANHYVIPELSPDGTSLFALYDTGRLVRWDVRPADWERRACAIAGRRLTRTEWAQALPQRKYNPTC